MLYQLRDYSNFQLLYARCIYSVLPSFMKFPLLRVVCRKKIFLYWKIKKQTIPHVERQIPSKISEYCPLIVYITESFDHLFKD